MVNISVLNFRVKQKELLFEILTARVPRQNNNIIIGLSDEKRRVMTHD